MRRGDVYMVDLEPTKGSEQRGKRPVLVVSPDALGKAFVPIVCPISGGGVEARYQGFTVSLQGSGMKTDGVVLCHQVRALDIKSRKNRRIEAAPPHIVNEVLAALQDIFEP